MSNRALFLDRDGTINVEKHYVFRIEDFEFRDGIFDLVKEYYNRGYLIFVITNQAGIARRLYTEADMNKLHTWMIEAFKKEGITISGVYHCPHHPDFSGMCNCRKPNPGMILNAIRDFDIDPAESVLIGDKKSDVQAGVNAGIGTNYLIKETGRISKEDVIIYKG